MLALGATTGCQSPLVPLGRSETRAVNTLAGCPQNWGVGNPEMAWHVTVLAEDAYCWYSGGGCCVLCQVGSTHCWLFESNLQGGIPCVITQFRLLFCHNYLLFGLFTTMLKNMVFIIQFLHLLKLIIQASLQSVKTLFCIEFS